MPQIDNRPSSGFSKALSVRDVTKSYGPANALVPVLRNFSFEVSDGEFVSLFGPNGCGKTTLLHLIAGIIKPDAGSVQSPPCTPPQRKVGIVFQNYEKSLLPWRTCLENIILPLEREWHGSKAQLANFARETVAALGIELPFERYPYELSGGQKQLACIARAMVMRPHLLLLDEPFGSLDYQTRLDTQRALQEAWLRARVSTILISHEIDEAIFLADRVCLLSQRPARIVESYPVTLPRPRDFSTLSSPEFSALRSAILQRFTHEVHP